MTVDGRRGREVEYVEVGYPREILKDRSTLVDTPGVNDLNEQRAEITYGYIPRADAVLFLLDGAQVLKQPSARSSSSASCARSRDKLIFVLGKMDMLAPDEREEALAYCREHLGADRRPIR